MPAPLIPSSEKKQQLDESTLNMNRKEGPDSQRRFQGRSNINLHVRNTKQDLINLVIPRGIGIKIHGHNYHKNRLAEGNLVSVYSNNQNPNELCKREYDELIEFRKYKIKCYQR